MNAGKDTYAVGGFACRIRPAIADQLASVRGILDVLRLQMAAATRELIPIGAD